MTAMAAAFLRAGMKPAEYEFAAHALTFLKSGFSVERGTQILAEMAKRLPPPAHVIVPTSQGQGDAAERRQPDEGDGATSDLLDGPLFSAPSPSPPREIAGHTTRANGRIESVGASREPSPAQRAVMGRVAQAIAVTVLDTLRIDGRPIGDWTVGEALARGREKTREGAILIEAARYYANADPFARIRDVIKPDIMQRIIQQAAEKADAA